MHKPMEIGTTIGVATSLYSYIGRNPKELVHRIGTMQLLVHMGSKYDEIFPHFYNSWKHAIKFWLSFNFFLFGPDVHRYRDDFLNMSLYRRMSGPNKNKIKESQNFNAFFHEL